MWITLADPRDGALYAALYAALNLCRYGVKLHRLDTGSDSWTEIAVPAYPLQPADSLDSIAWKNNWSVRWRRVGRISVRCSGTLPGGRFEVLRVGLPQEQCYDLV